MTMTQYIPAGVGEEMPSLWDRIKFNDEESPGIARVNTLERTWKWDDKKSKGTSGDARTFNGIDPMKISIEILLTTEEEHEDFKNRILPILDKPVGDKKSPDAINVTHAATDARKVPAISVDKLSGPNKSEQNQVTYTVQATEYRAPKPATVGGISGAKLVQIDDCAALNARRQQLFTELATAQNVVSLLMAAAPPRGDESDAGFNNWEFELNQASAKVSQISQAIGSYTQQAQERGCNDAPPKNESLQGPS